VQEDLLVEGVVVCRADVREKGPAGGELLVAVAADQPVRLAVFILKQVLK
jgi:hypothetical protein